MTTEEAEDLGWTDRYEMDREEMTQEEWKEFREDLDNFLKETEERFWRSIQIPPQPTTSINS